MRQINFILVTTILLFATCKGQTNSNSSLTFIDTTKPFKKEIPIYQDGTFNIFYKLAKTKQKQLGLDSLENGFDNLQIEFGTTSLLLEREN